MKIPNYWLQFADCSLHIAVFYLHIAVCRFEFTTDYSFKIAACGLTIENSKLLIAVCRFQFAYCCLQRTIWRLQFADCVCRLQFWSLIGGSLCLEAEVFKTLGIVDLICRLQLVDISFPCADYSLQIYVCGL